MALHLPHLAENERAASPKRSNACSVFFMLGTDVCTVYDGTLVSQVYIPSLFAYIIESRAALAFL